MRKHCKTCCLCMEHLRLQRKEPKIGGIGQRKGPNICHLQIPNICLLHPPHCKRVSTQQGCCHPFSVPQESTRIEWNIRNVIDYLPISTLRLLDTQQTAWRLCFTASQLGFSEWQRSMLTVSEKPCRSMWHFAMTWSMTRTGSRGIKLKNIKVRTEMGAMQAQCGCIMATFESTSGMMVWW